MSLGDVGVTCSNRFGQARLWAPETLSMATRLDVRSSLKAISRILLQSTSFRDPRF